MAATGSKFDGTVARLFVLRFRSGNGVAQCTDSAETMSATGRLGVVTFHATAPTTTTAMTRNNLIAYRHVMRTP